MSEERKAAERLIVKGIGAAILVALAFWAVPQIWDKLSPFIIAIPLAAMLQPVIRFGYEKLKVKRGITTLICVLLLLALLFGLIYWAVSVVLDQAPQVVGQSSSMISETANTLQKAVENLKTEAAANFSPKVRELIDSTLDDALKRITQWGTDLVEDIVSFTVSLVTGLPYLVIYVSFLAMALYFIAIHYGNIRSYLPGGKRRRQDSNTTQLTNSALKSLMGYLRVQGTFALMVLVISLIALHIFGFKYATVIAVGAGLMEMIPMIGSGLMYILMSIVYFLIGNTTAGIQVLVLTGVLQLLRRILEPKLMSNNIGISPLMSLIGMFVGMRIGGLLGLIGGPVAMAVLVGAVRGDVFKGINDDLYLIVQWFKRRWSSGDGTGTPEEKPPEAGGPSAEPANETVEETAEPDAEDAAKAETLKKKYKTTRK